MSDSRPWYRDAFKRDYLERYAHRNDHTAKTEIPHLLRMLQLPPAAEVLDLCCGAGRYTRLLSQSGLRMTGLDLSAELLAAARAADTESNYICGDMRRLPFADRSFAAVLNLFTSFGYFEDEADNQAVLFEVARILKPGGALLLDFLNIRYLLPRLQAYSEREQGSERIVEARRYHVESGRLEKRISIYTGSATQAHCKRIESVRAYTCAELTARMQLAGIEVVERYGNLKGVPFDEPTVERCVLLGKK